MKESANWPRLRQQRLSRRAVLGATALGAGALGLAAPGISSILAGRETTPTGETAYHSRSATLVVAASDAAPQSKLGADFVCDGTADEVEINAAISALPAPGGKVVLTEGTFELASAVALVSNTTLEGSGELATILHGDGSFDLLNLNNDATVCDLSLIAGIAATTEASSDHALDVNGVTGVEFRNVTVRRRGKDIANKYAMHALGTIDKTTRFLNCKFINESTETGSIHSARGAVVGQNPDSNTSPWFDGCLFQGAPGGSYAHGLTVIGASEANFVACRMIGGTGGSDSDAVYAGGTSRPEFRNCECIGGDAAAATNNQGALCGDSSAPTFHSCVLRGNPNLNGSTGHGVFCEFGTRASFVSCKIHNGRHSGAKGLYVSLGSCPEFVGCEIGPEPFSYNWDYDHANNGRFRPFSQGFAVLSLMVNVSVAHAGGTLDIGTSAGGSQVASNIDIGTTGNKAAEISRETVAAGGYLYATPSGPIGDNDVTIYYGVAYDFAACEALQLNSEGWPRFTGCHFYASGSSHAVSIASPATTVKHWRFDHCFLEAINASQCAVNAGAAIPNAPLYGCTFVGSLCNIASLAS